MKKRSIIFLLGLLTISILGIGVLKYIKRDNEFMRTQKDNRDLTIWVEDVENAKNKKNIYYNQLLKRFKIKYPTINISLKFIDGNTDKTYNYITTEILNQNAPDIMLLSLKNYSKFACNNQLYNLNNYIKEYEKDYFLKNIMEEGIYEGKLYGIPYQLDPEILVYRKDFLSDIDKEVPMGFNNIDELKDFLEDMDKIYKKDNLNKTAFGIPTLIKDGAYISSLFNKKISDKNTREAILKEDNKEYQILREMYNDFDISPYHSEKIGSHPFFSGEATFSIEPLSLIYAAIEKDSSLSSKIGIMPIKDSPLKFSYSNSKYISIFHDTKQSKEVLLFLDFFFKEEEVLERYERMNYPIILNSLKKAYLEDTKFDNQFILEYVQQSFHYKISPDMSDFLRRIDKAYEDVLHKNQKH